MSSTAHWVRMQAEENERQMMKGMSEERKKEYLKEKEETNKKIFDTGIKVAKWAASSWLGAKIFD